MSTEVDNVSRLAGLIQELGYRASLNQEHNTIETAMSGFIVVVFCTPNHSIQLLCAVALAENSGFGLKQANLANKQLRFAKFYIDSDDDLVMEADFLFDAESEGAAAQLASIFTLWEGSLALMKERLATAREGSPTPA